MALASVRPIFGALRETRQNAAVPRTLLVRGVMADVLARELTAGGDSSVVRVGGELGDADALVLVLSGQASEDEVELLRLAMRSGKVALVVQLRPAFDEEIPYVLATNVVDVPAGAGFPLDEICGLLARRLGERVVPLAASLPRLRGVAITELTREAARRNAIVVLSLRSPALHLPVMLTNQARLSYDIAAAYGGELGSTRLADGAAATGAAYGLRTLARRSVPSIPGVQRLARAGIAYAGTLAIGELARQRTRLPG
jgi:hypothetical protein